MSTGKQNYSLPKARAEEELKLPADAVTCVNEDRMVQVGIVKSIRKRRFRVISLGFPLWLLVLDKTVCESLHFYNYSSLKELLNQFEGDEQILIT